MSRPSIEPFAPHALGSKSWGTEMLFAHTSDYIGKVLYMDAGKGGNLQYHNIKDETFYLLTGTADVEWERDGEPQRTRMTQGMAFHVPPGAIHGVTAVTPCIFIEASTPVFDDRVIVEDRGVQS